MDTLTVDVRGLPKNKVHELERLIERWKQEHLTGEPVPIRKRRVDPAEFVPRKTKVKGRLTRALAYEE